MVVAKIAAIDSSTMTHSGSAAEDVAAILSLARGHPVGDVRPHVEMKQGMPDGQIERRSKVARDFPRRIEWMLECRATGGARKARLWGAGLLAADSPGVDSADAPGPGGVRRWSCPMPLDGPEGQIVIARALAWPSLSSTARHGMDFPNRSFKTQPSSSA